MTVYLGRHLGRWQLWEVVAGFIIASSWGLMAWPYVSEVGRGLRRTLGGLSGRLLPNLGLGSYLIIGGVLLAVAFMVVVVSILNGIAGAIVLDEFSREHYRPIRGASRPLLRL